MRLLYYALKYQGDYEQIKKAVLNNEAYEIVKYAGQYVTIDDLNYPKLLKQLDNPPYVLFYKGDLSLLNQTIVCVVGSRDCSEESQKLVQCLCDNKNTIFISGLAKGIDSYVHKYAKYSIGVIGCGINYIYPKINEYLYQKVKLLISEYPNNTLPLKHHFPLRNRIMVALAKYLIVVECQIKSGTMISVKHALELGKEIYVFPKSFFSIYDGNNLLIEEGANILKNVSDIKNIIK